MLKAHPAVTARKPPPKLLAGRRPAIDAYDADIVILSLDQPTETIETIQSALAQRGGMFHVTVLDQGSRPETRQTLARLFANTPHFSLYAAAKNPGVAAGRNLLATLGHGRIIVALDTGAVFAGKWVLAEALRAFNQRPELGALGFNILSAGAQTPDKSSWAYPLHRITRSNGRFDATTLPRAGHAIRRVTWNAAGGYDPGFFSAWEEYDFCLSAIARNWTISYDGTLAIIYKTAPNAPAIEALTHMAPFVRNRLLIGRKWGASWLALVPRMLAYLVTAFWHGCPRAAWDGIRAAYRDDPPTRRKMSKEMRRYIAANEARHERSQSAIV
ncbi:glycosyltransferase family 2 protein [Acidocella sp.]|uniref:glycosyltransferase family 2 protein n=1 Tax=Acidocella sp. TaxID=50710 RepID=UPI0026190056|nr:glycosyltransferase [Acidocella sp.]MDD2794582.1 glycosyltransferase [Acidocella sp.]